MNRPALRSNRSLCRMQVAGRTLRKLHAVVPASPQLMPGVNVAGASRTAATKAAGDSEELRLKDIVSIVSQDTKIVDSDCDKIIRAALGVIEETVAAGGKIQLTGVAFQLSLQRYGLVCAQRPPDTIQKHVKGQSRPVAPLDMTHCTCSPALLLPSRCCDMEPAHALQSRMSLCTRQCPGMCCFAHAEQLLQAPCMNCSALLCGLFDLSTTMSAVSTRGARQVVAGHYMMKCAGFGTFKRTETAPRTGRNPQTGEPLDVPASARPTFSAGKGFKDAVKSRYTGK